MTHVRIINQSDGIIVRAGVPTDAKIIRIGIARTRVLGAVPGDVVGPASATDEAIARFDLTTGKLLQDSSVTIDDSGNVSLPALATVDGRDVSVDGAKLDGVEALADVTDATNVAAAGAVMDSDFAGTDTGVMRRTGVGSYAVRKDNLTAIVAPGAGDNIAEGYSVGSVWFDTVLDLYHLYVSETGGGAATWLELGSGGGFDVEVDTLAELYAAVNAAGPEVAEGNTWHLTGTADADAERIGFFDSDGIDGLSPHPVLATLNGLMWPVNFSTMELAGAASAAVDTAGVDYTVGDILTDADSSATTPATFTVTGVTGGGPTGPVDTVTLLSKGVGYTQWADNPIAMNGGTGTGCLLDIAASTANEGKIVPGLVSPFTGAQSVRSSGVLTSTAFVITIASTEDSVFYFPPDVSTPAFLSGVRQRQTLALSSGTDLKLFFGIARGEDLDDIFTAAVSFPRTIQLFTFSDGGVASSTTVAIPASITADGVASLTAWPKTSAAYQTGVAHASSFGGPDNRATAELDNNNDTDLSSASEVQRPVIWFSGSLGANGAGVATIKQVSVSVIRGLL